MRLERYINTVRPEEKVTFAYMIATRDYELFSVLHSSTVEIFQGA